MEEAAAALERWRARLAGLAPLELPTDRRRPARPDLRGARLTVRTPAELGSVVNELADRTGSTPFMVLLASGFLLLGRYSGQRDLAVCTSVPGRAHPGAERLRGAFANTLVLRGDLSGGPTFTGLLERVRATVLDAFQDGEVPFERLAGMAAGAAPGRVRFELRPPTAAPLDAEVPELGSAELGITVHQCADGTLECGFDYATALFDRATIERFAYHYQRLLAHALLDPGRPLDRLIMLSEAERHTLTRGWRDTTVAAPPQCLPELIAEQAARTPPRPP